MRQNESLHVAIAPNANVLLDGKSLHRVAHAVQMKIYTGPLIAFAIYIRIRITHKCNLSLMLKLRFHLCVMRMMNVNAKKNQNIELV